MSQMTILAKGVALVAIALSAIACSAQRTTFETSDFKFNSTRITFSKKGNKTLVSITSFSVVPIDKKKYCDVKIYSVVDANNDGDFDASDVIAIIQALAGEFPKTFVHVQNNSVPDVYINPATGNVTVDTEGIEIGNIVIDSAAGIFNGANSPSWDAPGAFSADIDTQISMPISFGEPGFNGIDNLGDGVVGATPANFDFLADLTVSYLDASGALLDGEIHRGGRRR